MRISQITSTADEVKMLKSFDARRAQGTMEKFYLAILDIPQLSERLTSMSFKYRSKDQLAEIREKLSYCKNAEKEIRDSESFQNFYRLFLEIGNCERQSSGDAPGSNF